MRYEKGTFFHTPNKTQLHGEKPAVQTVFHWICNYTNARGYCFPSLEKLAEDSGITRPTVIEAIKVLEKKGLIKKTMRYSTKGLSNVYQVMILPMGKFREYNENKHQSDGLPEVDNETGGIKSASAPKNVKSKYWDLIKWAEKRRGSPFLKQSVPKQFKAFAIAKTNGIKPPDLLKRWQQLEEDKFYSERGFDWMDVVQSFNRKGK